MPIPRLTSESGFTGFQDSARDESAITACPISGLASARAHSRSSDPLAQPQCLHCFVYGHLECVMVFMHFLEPGGKVNDILRIRMGDINNFSTCD